MSVCVFVRLLYSAAATSLARPSFASTRLVFGETLNSSCLQHAGSGRTFTAAVQSQLTQFTMKWKNPARAF